MMLALDKDSWVSQVEEATGWVLVDFWSPQCKPCLELTPHLEKLSKEYEGHIQFCSLDISKARRVAISQGVMGLPTVVFYYNGEKKDELAGQITAKDVEGKIRELCFVSTGK